MTPTDPIKDMLGREQLRSVSDARNLLFSELANLSIQTETIPLEHGLGRISGSEIYSPEDLPRQNRSTMDGYAVVSADTFGATESMPGYLEISGEVKMGANPHGTVTRGQCFKIPTGGILPEGADAVVMFEHTVLVDDKMIEVVKSVGSGGNVIKKGEDIKKSAQAIPKNKKLSAYDLGLLAGLGIVEIEVYKKVSVGIISTGDEVAPYDEPLPPGKIRNINSMVLRNLSYDCGVDVIDYGIVADTEEMFFSTVQKAVEETDLVLFSGGSSVGVSDLGEQAIARAGDPGVLIHGVKLKPGKPVIIGFCNQVPVFGLPGHPVSAAICFDLFVKPTIQRISGKLADHINRELTISAILKRSINSAAGRLDIVRVSVEQIDEGYEAHPVLGKSGSISSLAKADGFFIIEEPIQGLPENSTVEVFIYK